MVSIGAGVGTKVAPISVEVSLIFGFFKDGLLFGSKLLFIVALMIFLKDDEEVCFRMHLYLAWCVPGLKHFLRELLSRVLNLKDAKGIVSDGDNTFGASLRAERTSMAQRFVTQRGHTVLAHVVVAKPWLV